MKDLKQELLDFLDSKIHEEEFWMSREIFDENGDRDLERQYRARSLVFREVKKFIEKFEVDVEEERKKAIKEYLEENPIEITEEERTAIRKQWKE